VTLLPATRRSSKHSKLRVALISRQFLQYERAKTVRIALACPRDLYDSSGDDLDERVRAVHELEGTANRLKGGRHAFNLLRLKDPAFEIWRKGH